MLEKILTHLAELEEREGNREKAIFYLEESKPLSPRPDMIQQRIDELKLKTASDSAAENSRTPKTGKP